MTTPKAARTSGLAIRSTIAESVISARPFAASQAGISSRGSFRTTGAETCRQASRRPGRLTGINSAPAWVRRSHAARQRRATSSSISTQKHAGRPRRTPFRGVGVTGSSPVSTASSRARSATETAIGPTVSLVWLMGSTPAVGYLRPAPLVPTDGRKPAIPHSAAGIRIEPEVSVPSPAPTIPAAIAAAVPPDEPPVIRPGSCGFRAVGIGAKFVFVTPKASSCRLVFPNTIAPASSRRCATGPVCLARSCARAGVAPDVIQPAISILSFTATGSPASTGKVAPRPRARSTERACSSAFSGSR